MKRIFSLLLIVVLVMNTGFIFAETNTNTETGITMTLDSDPVYLFTGTSDQEVSVPVEYVLSEVVMTDEAVELEETLVASLIDGVDTTVLEYEMGAYSIAVSSEVEKTLILQFDNGDESITKKIEIESPEMALISSRYDYLNTGSEVFKGEYVIKNLQITNLEEGIDPEDVSVEVFNASNEPILDGEGTQSISLEAVGRNTKVIFEGAIDEDHPLENGEIYTVIITGPDDNGSAVADTHATDFMILESTELIAMSDTQRMYRLYGEDLDLLTDVEFEVQAMVEEDLAFYQNATSEVLEDYQGQPVVVTIETDTDDDYWLEHENLMLQNESSNLLAFETPDPMVKLIKLVGNGDNLDFYFFGFGLDGISEIKLPLVVGYLVIYPLIDEEDMPYTEEPHSGLKVSVPLDQLNESMDKIEFVFGEDSQETLFVFPENLFTQPEVSVSNLTNGLIVADEVIPNIIKNIEVDLEMTLNDEEYLEGTPINEIDDYVLVINGTDSNGKAIEEITIEFKVYHTPRIELKKIEAKYGDRTEFKTRIFDGKPLEGILVKFYVNDIFLGDATTDEEGYAALPILSTYDPGEHELRVVTVQDDEGYFLSNEKTAKMYVVTNTYTSQKGFVSGGGKTTDGHYSMNVKLENGLPSGHFHYQVKASKDKFVGLEITNLSIDDQTVVFSGTGFVPRTKGHVEFTVRIDLDAQTMEVDITGAFTHHSGSVKLSKNNVKIK